MAPSRSTKPEEEETELFLKYTDEEMPSPHPNPSEKSIHTTQAQAATRRNAFLSHILTVLATSIIWLVILVLSLSSTFPSSPNKPTHHEHEHEHPIPSHVPSQEHGNRHNITSSSTYLSCGKTPTQARAANCIYDALLNHWVPTPCYDAEFLAEYLEDGSSGAFADSALSIPLPLETLGEREEYWTSVRDHVNHCAMMWKKQFWVLFEERREVDSIVASAGHTDHCAYYLTLEREGGDWEGSTRVQVGFAGCWVRD